MLHIIRLVVPIVVLTFNFVNGDQATNGSGLAITEIGNVSGFLDQNESCKEGYFSIEAKTKNGCLPCFCYGHSSQCKSSSEYVKSNDSHFFSFCCSPLGSLTSSFKQLGNDVWRTTLDGKKIVTHSASNLNLWGYDSLYCPKFKEVNFHFYPKFIKNAEIRLFLAQC